jgi:hypothetical protein
MIFSASELPTLLDLCALDEIEGTWHLWRKTQPPNIAPSLPLQVKP